MPAILRPTPRQVNVLAAISALFESPKSYTQERRLQSRHRGPPLRFDSEIENTIRRKRRFPQKRTKQGLLLKAHQAEARLLLRSLDAETGSTRAKLAVRGSSCGGWYNPREQVKVQPNNVYDLGLRGFSLRS